MKELRDDPEKAVSSSVHGACTSACADMCVREEVGTTCTLLCWASAVNRQFLLLEMRLVVFACQTL